LGNALRDDDGPCALPLDTDALLLWVAWRSKVTSKGTPGERHQTSLQLATLQVRILDACARMNNDICVSAYCSVRLPVS